MGVNFNDAFYTSLGGFLGPNTNMGKFNAEGMTPDQIINTMAAGKTKEEIATAVTKALIDTGFAAGGVESQLQMIYEELGLLPSKMQKWSLIINDGRVTGGDTEVLVEGPDLPAVGVSITEVVEEATGDIVTSAVFNERLLDALTNPEVAQKLQEQLGRE